MEGLAFEAILLKETYYNHSLLTKQDLNVISLKTKLTLHML